MRDRRRVTRGDWRVRLKYRNIETMGTDDKNFLGIDWGASDVGVAFADAETRIAFALTTLRNDAELLQKVGEIVNLRNIGVVVVGDNPRPRGWGSGSAGDDASPGRRFGGTLASEFPVTVVYQDETFSTRMAETNLIERGAKRISRFDDSEAARIILQDWLDRDAVPR